MIDLSGKSYSILKNDRFLDWIIAPLFLLFVILIGYYGLFFEQILLVDVDAVLNFYHHEKNKYTDGWRPDIALGLTYFLSDPGLCFTWGFVRWWNELFDDGVTAFQALSMAIIWFCCIVQFVFIRRTVPSIGRFFSLMLSVLIAFSSLRYEFLFLRSSAPQVFATPLLSLILHDFLKGPRLRHYFQYTVVIFFITFLGNAISLFQMFWFMGIFCFAVVFFHKWHKSFKDFWRALKRFMLLNFAAGFSLFTLGGWFFYSVAFEYMMVGYVRDPDYTSGDFFRSFSLFDAIRHFFSYFHSGLFSLNSSVLGVDQKLYAHSFSNFSPLFPFIFIVILFWKSRTVWEYYAKFIVLASYLLTGFMYWVPGYMNLVTVVFKFYPPDKPYPSIQVYQILLLAFFIERLRSNKVEVALLVKIILRGVAVLVSLIYAGLFSVAVITLNVPNSLTNIFLEVAENFSSDVSSLMPTLVEENIKLFHQTMGWPSVLFYGSTAFLILWFAFGIERKTLFSKNPYALIGAFFLNALLLSWSIYPLNKEPLIWSQQKINGIPIAKRLLPTDRLVRVGVPPCRGQRNYEDCILDKFFNEEFGARRYMVGYRDMPILEFSATRSFTPKHVAEFIKTFMALENTNTPGILRDLEMEPPIFDSRVYDISAVKYLLSKDPLPEMKHLGLVHKSKQFYLYRNHKAWPYYYLADRIEFIEAYEDLYNAEQGVAYLWEDDVEHVLPFNSLGRNRSIELIKFKYGDVEFNYSSEKQSFLVMADSWHPNWQASLNGKEIPIIKTNGVFKGVQLPPGAGKVHFFFDNSLYEPGIWISVIAWSLFLLAWGWCAFKWRERY